MNYDWVICQSVELRDGGNEDGRTGGDGDKFSGSDWSEY